MNRSERRKLERKQKAESKKAFWNMKESEREHIQRSTEEYVKKQFKLAEEKIREREEEIKEKLEEVVKNTWDKLEKCLAWVMKENRISEERIDRVFEQLNKRMKEEDEVIEIKPTRVKDRYVVMNKGDYLTYMSEIMDINCKNCNKKCSKCSIYKMLEQYGVPRFDGTKKKKNCKYAY